MTILKNTVLTDAKLSRRTFLKAGTLAAAGPLLVSNPKKAAANLSLPVEDYKDEYKFTTCDMCFNRCGAIARVREGKIIKLDANPYFTKSRGMLCGRGIAGIAQPYDPDRVKEPMLRVGKRGEGKWKPISWNEALDMTAEKLLEIGKKYTRCGVMFSSGADMQTTFINRFAGAFGSYNTSTQESLCLFSMHRAYLDTFGEIPMPDIRECKYIFMPGSNRFESLVTPDSMDMMEALKNGAKLCVVDPRFTKTAGMATDWLQIKPGTDMALAYALCHVLLSENLVNTQWLQENTFGVEQLTEHIKDFTPEFAEKETGIKAEVIRKVAREMGAAAPKALVYPGRRTSDYRDSTQIRRAYAILNALLCNFDQPGGLLVPAPIKLKTIPLDAPWYDDNPPDKVDIDYIPLPFKEESSFMPMREAALTGKPYPIKGWLTFKTNPMQTAPCRQKTMEMANSMEFMVSLDITYSDTANFADIILPCHSYLERQDPIQMLPGGNAGSCLVWREPVIPPQVNSKNPFDIMKELAQRMELGEHFDFTIEDFRKAQLSGLPEEERPIAEKALKEKGVYHPENQEIYGRYKDPVYKTSSKKIDIYSALYEKKKLDPLPVYQTPKTEADKFRLVAGRNALITQTSSQNNALLIEFVPTNTLHIHPKKATALGIKDKDVVEVSNSLESQTLKAQLNPGIEENTVYMHSGFGSLSKQLSHVYQNGASIAAVMDDAMDAISGNAAHHETFVTVKKV